MNPQAMTVKAKQPEGPTVAAADVIDKGLFQFISRYYQKPNSKYQILGLISKYLQWDYNWVQ